jgi:N utilization substance protein B
LTSRRERHRAREAALQILYQWELGGVDVDRASDTYFQFQWSGDEAPAAVQELARDLARDTVQRLDRIDGLIAKATEHWRPERMAVVDRLILRLSVCQFLRDPPTPPAVVIDEALELARTFSGDEAVKFVNGVLDAVGRSLGLIKTRAG